MRFEGLLQGPLHLGCPSKPNHAAQGVLARLAVGAQHLNRCRLGLFDRGRRRGQRGTTGVGGREQRGRRGVRSSHWGASLGPSTEQRRKCVAREVLLSRAWRLESGCMQSPFSTVGDDGDDGNAASSPSG